MKHLIIILLLIIILVLLLVRNKTGEVITTNEDCILCQYDDFVEQNQDFCESC